MEKNREFQSPVREFSSPIAVDKDDVFMLIAGVQFLTQSLTTEGEEDRDTAVRIV